VIGISGGVDSATTTFLAVKDLGKENVLGLIMPYQLFFLSESFKSFCD